MAGENVWMIFATLGFFHLTANLLLTKEVFDHIPDKKDAILLYVLIWCVPVAGAFYTFRKIGLEHYKSRETGEHGLSLGLLGMDEIFNPSAKPRYSIEETVQGGEDTSSVLTDSQTTHTDGK